MITRDLGSNHFWGIDKAIAVPLFYTTTVHEVQHPYRSATAKGVCIPGTKKSVLFGRWGQAADNLVTHLLDALRGRNLGPQVTEEMA